MPKGKSQGKSQAKGGGGAESKESSTTKQPKGGTAVKAWFRFDSYFHLT